MSSAGFDSWTPEVEEGVSKQELVKDVELVTDYGTIVFRLSDETPLHRNNFIRLVNQGFYDSLLFHRVINNFLVQTGDPDS
jgi:cyclophilin family peptidyl-prolyl cis-trans isomerase